jgi:heptosyltransferase-2
MKKILVIQTAFIGDAILATSVLESIHKAHPDARIDFLIRKGNDGLFKAHPFIHTLLIWDKNSGKFTSLLRVLKAVRGEQYDIVINLHRFVSSGILTAFSNAKLKLGFKKNPLSFLFDRTTDHLISTQSESSIHEVERNHGVLLLWQDMPLLPPRLYPSDGDYAKIEELTSQSFITISPASVWETKMTPLDVWERFINEVKTEKVYLNGGPGDKVLCEKLKARTTNKNVVVIAGQLSLLQSAALMSKAKRNFVNDSGPLHLCSAMNAPVTAVFCSTVPSFGFGPLSENFDIVQTYEDLPCRPCGLHGKRVCPEGHFKCGNSIDSNALLNTLK